MPPTITRQQAREVDQRAIEQYGMSGLVLMENAGRGTADVLCRLARSGSGGRLGRVAVCCGKGNNAGDGFVIARHLDLRGVEVRVLVWADPAELTGDAGTNFNIIRHDGRADRSLRQSPQPSPIGRAVGRGGLDRRRAAGHRGPRRASSAAGCGDRSAQCRGGEAIGCRSAQWPGLRYGHGCWAHDSRGRTCTFVAMKRGFAAPGAEQYTGRIHVLDIGAPRRLVEEVLAAASVANFVERISIRWNGMNSVLRKARYFRRDSASASSSSSTLRSNLSTRRWSSWIWICEGSVGTFCRLGTRTPAPRATGRGPPRPAAAG